MSLEEVDGMKGAAVEPPQSMKMCRIHLERSTAESRYERDVGHGHHMTGVAAPTSANVCSVKKKAQKTT